ncbi:MAG TPA: hypothetical protein DIC19_06060 [Erysipelotrichaceae bacterium]|nr:hypothetical protein [Erysipelotrichaceae bacterium]
MRQISPIIHWIILSTFALAMVFMLYLAAITFDRMHDEANQMFNERTLHLYFNQRFKQADALGALVVEDNRLQINHPGYYTLLYLEDGYLVEQVSETNQILEKSGQRIAEIAKLSFRSDGQQIIVDVIHKDLEAKSYHFTLISEVNS